MILPVAWFSTVGSLLLVVIAVSCAYYLAVEHFRDCRFVWAG